jgi:hypothetical protein
MTTHDRHDQTLCTLRTFTKSNVTVIMVDDSRNGFFTEAELSQYGFQITYITIEFNKKTWINPCVNYNIAFQEVITDKVIIQNAEVCHIGDVTQYVAKYLNNENYVVFDVAASRNTQMNGSIPFGDSFFNIYLYMVLSGCIWYQHCRVIPEQPGTVRNLHFLTAITKSNLDKLGGFDYYFALGSWYDDNEFLYRIIKVLKLNICNVCCEDTQLMGIHQWHLSEATSMDQSYRSINRELYRKKCP